MTTRSTTPGTEMVHGGVPILADIRRRFGGIDTPAAIVGALTAIGVITFLTALLAAGSASIAFQMDLIDIDGNFSDFDTVGFVVALGVVFVGFLVGGWAAGRMARYDGGKNGLAAAFWMLLIIVGFAAAGLLIAEEYNALAATELPDWMSQVAADDATAEGIAAAVVAVVVMFLGGWLGGRIGETYHHHVDAAVAHAARHPEQHMTEPDDPAIRAESSIAGADTHLDADAHADEEPDDLDLDGDSEEAVAARSRMRAPDADPGNTRLGDSGPYPTRDGRDSTPH